MAEINSTTGHEGEVIDVQGLKASLKKGGNKGIFNEAICSTAGGTAAKVTNTTPASFTLENGATIIVKFTYAISVADATLQVGSAPAKPIYYRGAALEANKVKAGDKVLLRYDGTSFNIIGSLGETYENKQAASGGTDVSLVTTGEKYAWNQKQDAITFNTAYNASTNKAATMSDITKANVGLSNVTNDAQIPLSQKGSANGVAELDANGKVPSSQLPSYVDDVIEGYYYNSKFYKESTHTTEIAGESGKIYTDLSTDTTYRWSGTAFVQIKGDLVLGETSSTAYRGDRGKTAYDHSQSAHAPSDANKFDLSYASSKLTKTVNGSATDVVSASTIVTDGGGIKRHATHKLDATNGTASSVSQGTEITYVESVAGTTTATSGNLSVSTTRKKITVPAIPEAATQSADGLMSAADKEKLDGISTGANNYSHPTGDGYSHVPATGTTNNGKVLMAGSTANSASWQSLGTASKKNVPTSGNAAATEVVMGNDSRLSDSRTPTSHAHGNITNTGTITSTVVTSATGILVYDSNNKIQRATAAQTRSIIGAGTSSLAIGTTSTTALKGDTKWAASSTAGGDAINADKVDGYHIAVVSSMPASPDENTIYIVK